MTSLAERGQIMVLVSEALVAGARQDRAPVRAPCGTGYRVAASAR